MATVTPSLAVKTNILTVINDALNGGSGAAKIDIYSGVKPTGPDVVPTIPSLHVLLGTLTCSDPAGSISTISGVPTLTFGAVTQDSSADASGVASWARLSSTGGATVAVLDVDITTTGGGGFAQMNTTNIVAGGPITAPSIVITA